MDRETAVDLLDRLHAAQNDYYSGGSGAELEQLLAPGITWTVPGDNRIAGTYRGLADVLAYFRRRRDLADRTFRLERRDVLTGAGRRVAALTDGFARIGGRDRRWSTVGLYDLVDGRISACWLLPLDPGEFDAIWSG
jgi:ketosteroid isomerase-like protein